MKHTYKSEAIVLLVVALVLLFFNLIYCSFTVQYVWVTHYNEVSSLYIGNRLMDYINHFTAFAVIVNFCIVIFLLYLSWDNNADGSRKHIPWFNKSGNGGSSNKESTKTK